MNNRDEKSMVLLWRLVTVIIGLAWIISFLVRIFVLSDWSLEQDLMSRNVYIGFCVLTALMLIALMIVPFQFYIHAAFCWLWSMARLIDGGVTNALLIHFLSYIFLYRQGFFNTRRRIKLIIGGCFLAAAIASQIRFGYIILSQQLIRLFEMGFVVFVTAVFLRPQIRQIANAEQILRLPPDLYSEDDAVILRKIIAGEKYETIARETGRSVSTVKNHIHGIFQRLQIADRVTFLSRYATHRIVREEKNN